MSRRYQSGCLYRETRKAGPDVWVFRYRDGQTNRKEIIGTVEQFPTKTKALKACELLRTNINREARSPRTVAELVAHYTGKELAEDGSKAYSTREVYGSYIRTWILPTWGTQQLSDVKTVAVEALLRFHWPTGAKRKSVTSCPRFSLMQCGMNGSIETRSLLYGRVRSGR